MNIKENDNLPNSEVFIIEDGEPVKKKIEDIFKNKKVVIFGLPGAYTSVCSAKHLPGYVNMSEKYKDRGFDILGVCSSSWKDVEACRTKVKKQKMDWVNLSDKPYPLAWVKKYYDLRSNPFIYLLDENKNILFKRISAEQLDQILEREIERYEKEKKAKKN